MMVPIKDFEGYFADDNGDIFSSKIGKTLRKMSFWHGKNNNYPMVGLVKNGKRYRLLVHRIIALCFVPNPQGLPEVNHIDGDMTNCRADNLEWVSHRQNMLDCFKRHSQIRNFRKCELYYENEFIAEFISIKAAVRFAVEQYNAKYSVLEKYKKYNNISIKCID